MLCIVTFTLPETARNVVGNVSKEATGWERTFWNTLMGGRRGERKKSRMICDPEGANEKVGSGKSGKREKFKLADALAPTGLSFGKTRRVFYGWPGRYTQSGTAFKRQF